MASRLNCMELGGTLTQEEVRAAFEERRVQDRNGPDALALGESYSGGFNTVEGLEFLNPIRTYGEAEAYAEVWAQKYGPALARRVGTAWVIFARCAI